MSKCNDFLARLSALEHELVAQRVHKAEAPRPYQSTKEKLARMQKVLPGYSEGELLQALKQSKYHSQQAIEHIRDDKAHIRVDLDQDGEDEDEEEEVNEVKQFAKRAVILQEKLRVRALQRYMPECPSARGRDALQHCGNDREKALGCLIFKHGYPAYDLPKASVAKPKSKAAARGRTPRAYSELNVPLNTHTKR